MFHVTDDLRIDALKPLIPPAILIEELPVSERASSVVVQGREEVAAALRGEDPRLVVVIGPCSIHDLDAAHEYARRLVEEARRHRDRLIVLMRVYFEKPRTTVGWKGLINDPHLDGSYRINDGLRYARSLLVDLAEMGLPVGCEFLDTITPQFIADLVSWGAIGARTTESQVHRELASGLSVPVGFKNGTDGNIQISLDAIGAAAHPHVFLSVTKQGLAAIVHTRGNGDCHLILRGSAAGPNYDPATVRRVSDELAAAGYHPRLMVDCSHGNSGRDPARQEAVVTELAEAIAGGLEGVFGVMIEGHLEEGSQTVDPGRDLVRGLSITDPCMGWEACRESLEVLAKAVEDSRGR